MTVEEVRRLMANIQYNSEKNIRNMPGNQQSLYFIRQNSGLN